jgi:succinate-semialdehyde dehydrogenase/glutarate-semialdehyde dehydrogenase
VAVTARFLNNGQSCVNAKRFIVEESVADEFVQGFCAGVARLAVGDPLDPRTTIGPMARDDLRRDLHDQVERTVAGGGKLQCGGNPIPGQGFFYAPTVIDHVQPGMAAFDEETFGPVAAVTRASDTGEALRLANLTQFGLGASLWSRDVDTARRLARQIDAGAVFVNAMVASDPRLPFGGIKKSGYGRELGVQGLREFVNVKTLWTGPAVASLPNHIKKEQA